MNPKIFISYLPWLLEPHEKLESQNLLGDYEETCKKRKTPIRRTVEFTLPALPKELQELFGVHDLGNIHMLWTSFWSEPKKLEQGWAFADMSEVNIVVAPSGRVEAYNAHPIRGMPGATDCLGVLAKDLESYLEALFYAQFNATHFISGFPDEDPILYQKTVLVAKHCALMAGGYEYYDFWAGILGLPFSETVPE